MISSRDRNSAIRQFDTLSSPPPLPYSRSKSLGNLTIWQFDTSLTYRYSSNPKFNTLRLREAGAGGTTQVSPQKLDTRTLDGTYQRARPIKLLADGVVVSVLKRGDGTKPRRVVVVALSRRRRCRRRRRLENTSQISAPVKLWDFGGKKLV